MNGWLEEIKMALPLDVLIVDWGIPALRAALIMISGHLLSRLIVRWLKRWHLEPQVHLILQRGTTLTLFVLTLTWALHELGFGLGPLVGAAGVFTVAIGFAARTSVSNLISGIFLIGERPFVVGDVIDVSGSRGHVVSIDAMAVRIRTFDNLVVRIPNETLLNASLTNHTALPIRRHDLRVSIDYAADFDQVRQVMLDVAVHTPGVLVEPEPVVILESFEHEGMKVRFSAWCPREEYVNVTTATHEGVKTAFEEAGIQIAMPRLAIDRLSGGASEAVGAALGEPPTMRVES